MMVHRNLLIAFILQADMSASGQSTVVEEPIVLRQCPISALNAPSLSFPVSGIVEQINVREGDIVRQGDVLMQLDATEAVYEYEIQARASEDNSEELMADEKKKLWEAERDSNNALDGTPGQVSETDKRKTLAQLGIAIAELQKARAARSQAEIKKQAAKTRVERHWIKSPIDGKVELIVPQERESIEALKPLIRVVSTDLVRVKGTVELSKARKVKVGMQVDVYPEIVENPSANLAGHTGPIRSIVILPHRPRLLSAGADGQIIEWDIASNTQVQTWKSHTGEVHAITVSPLAPDMLFSGGDDGILRIRNITSEQAPVEITTRSPILSLAASATDVNLIYTGHQDQKIRIWDVKSRELKQELSGHRNFVQGIELSPDGKTMLSYDSMAVRLWDLPGRKTLREETGRSNEVHRLGLSADGTKYLFNNLGILRVWNVAKSSSPVSTLTMKGGSFADLAVFTPTPGVVIVGTNSHRLELWQYRDDARSERLVRQYDAGTGAAIHAIAVSPKGDFFVTGGNDQILRMWTIPSADQIDRERLGGRIKFVSTQIDPGQGRGLFADIDNVGNVLEGGGLATLVIYPSAPIDESGTGNTGVAPERTIAPEPLPTIP